MSESLNKNEVEAVVQFAQGLWTYERYGIYTPWMQNNILNNLNNSAKIPTSETIKQSLSEYKNSAENLQNYMQFMQHFDMLFARTVKSYVNMLAFDLSWVCINANKEDYNTEEFNSDKKIMYDFLDKFKYKEEFRKSVEIMMINEVFYTWLRKSGRGKKTTYALQIMPQDRCMITGSWKEEMSGGLLYDFDLNYFLQAGIDIDGYDSFFKKQLNALENADEYINYNPTASLKNHTGRYAFWTQTSPKQNAWVFKFDMSNYNATPFLSSLLKDAIRDNEVGELQFNKDIISAYGILAGSIPLFDNAKSGTTADQFAINPKTLGGFMAKAKAGLNDKIKLAALPLDAPKMYQFNDNNPDMYKNQLTTTAGVGSGLSRVIYSSDRVSNAELEAGIIDQYNTMKPLYYQFENFLNFFVNQLTKKFKFKFIFDGCNYSFEREKRFNRAISFADKGMVLAPSYYSSILGFEPQDFERMLEQSKYSNWNELWQLPLNSNTTASSGLIEKGRPTIEDSELTEGGQNYRDSNGEL